MLGTGSWLLHKRQYVTVAAVHSTSPARCSREMRLLSLGRAVIPVVWACVMLHVKVRWLSNTLSLTCPVAFLQHRKTFFKGFDYESQPVTKLNLVSSQLNRRFVGGTVPTMNT